ncbi:integrator complex subunit 4 [Musa troglodytarum]|uniref:Integrator complex subunit 4 n=1 Tax=Musa troglodytarum TaxID=320322 RepID=A0A9E7G4Q9_9LILI|nr:integrator complex subunit 4 [Musa troglodytarum]
MERALLERLQRRLSPGAADARGRIQALCSARSLIANPDSTESTRRSVVDALVASVRHHQDDPAFVHHALKLLGDAAVLCRPFAHSVVAAVRPFLDGGHSLTADAVASLASVVEADNGGGGEGFSLVASALDGDRILSLASSPIVAVRSQVLDLLVRSVERGRFWDSFGHHTTIQVFLGLAMDLYPLVRKRACDGIIALLREAAGGVDRLIVECCYDRAVVLLKDEEKLVRLTAVKLISECGELFAASQGETEHSEQMDVVFVQLCLMARDMCMEVRFEAFVALGKVRLVHETVLLQSLSKKILGIKSGKAIVECSTKGTKISLLSAAGAFVHGIEDEFYEVREAACRSLGMLTIFSVKFAYEATNLLMDMLNDDTEVVRLQTLQTLSHMANYDRLTMQDKHMQMCCLCHQLMVKIEDSCKILQYISGLHSIQTLEFSSHYVICEILQFLGLLADISASIRCLARKLLQLVKLPDFISFRDTIDCLISNLEAFPEEEEDIFFVLFSVGKRHKNFSAKLAKEFAKEIDLSCGELILDSHEVAAKLVLFISSSFSSGQRTTDIPMALYSYAVPFSGRIARALSGAVDQDSLLAYLCSHSKKIHKICTSSMPIHIAISDITRKGNVLDFSEILTCSEQTQEKCVFLNEETMQSIKLNLETVRKTWPLMKSHCTQVVQNMLRACKEELETIAWNADDGDASSFLDFAALYIQVIQLVTEILDKSLPKKSCIIGMTALDIILERLDMSLRRLRYGFSGLQRDEECHILELMLLSYVFRLLEIGVSRKPILARLTSTISRLEFLCEGPSNLSVFAKEVKHACTEGTATLFSNTYVFHKLLELFYPEQITFTGRFKQKKAEVLVIGNDSENPLTFVLGLPVGIFFRITLYEILNSDRLWLLLAVGESIQYVFLDLSQFEGCDAVRSCTLNVPFHGTPKAASFLLRASVGIECPSEDVTNHSKGQGWPVDDYAIICKENDVHFISVNNR